MAVTASVNLSSSNSYAAGSTPAPVAYVTVASSAAVVVTGLDIYFTDQNNAVIRPAGGPIVPPIGVGQPTSILAGGSTVLGPMAMAFGSVANGNSYQAVPPGAQPANPQGSALSQQQVIIRARVYTSDGAITEAAPVALLVSYTSQPPAAFQGGFANFIQPNNAALLAAVL